MHADEWLTLSNQCRTVTKVTRYKAGFPINILNLLFRTTTHNRLENIKWKRKNAKMEQNKANAGTVLRSRKYDLSLKIYLHKIRRSRELPHSNDKHGKLNWEANRCKPRSSVTKITTSHFRIMVSFHHKSSQLSMPSNIEIYF